MICYLSDRLGRSIVEKRFDRKGRGFPAGRSNAIIGNALHDHWATMGQAFTMLFPDSANNWWSATQNVFYNNLQVRKRHFLSHLYIKSNILPRQARDEHRENSKKVPFSLRAGCPRNHPAVRQVRKRYCLSVCTFKRSFCQDRLGTNIGRTQKREPFFLQA